MKDLRPALRAFLLGSAPIAAIVAQRVYPGRMPQGVNQASIVYTRVSGQGDHTMSGPTGLARPRIQIDCWAPKADDALKLADLVKDRLDGYRGVMGSGPAAIDVQGVFFDSERDGFDDSAELHSVSRDYFIFYEER